MATYNGAAYLREQLASLAAQSVQPRELQIGDDGSTDDTLSVIADFAATAPFPVHVHRNPRNLGFGENFIGTALRCSGDWIAFCDQDDVWLPDKLSWAAAQIAAGPGDLALLAHDAMVTDEALQPIKPLYAYRGETRTRPLGLPPEWFCVGVTQLFRRGIIADIPSHRRVSFPWHKHRDAHDVWIALLANCVGTVLRSDRQLVLYRRHGQTVTDQAKSAQVPTWARFDGSSYNDRAFYLREVAALMAQLATEAASGFGPSLAAAATAIDAHAEAMSQRGRALTAAGLSDRLRALRRAIAGGAYSSGSRWSFGKARLAKDALGTLLASVLARRGE